MKQGVFIVFFLLLSGAAFAQDVPDTIWVENITDSTFIIAVGTMNKRNEKMNIEYIDNVFDSVGVAEFAFNRIERNESTQREADLIKLRANALMALYSDVNGILQNFTGNGYLNNAFQKFAGELTGFYRAELNASQILIYVKPDATAVQVNAQGQPVEGGFTGTWDVINPSRWRLKDFFPVNILPAGSVLNRLNKPDNAFMAVGSAIVLTKIQ